MHDVLRKADRIAAERQDYPWGYVLWFGSWELGNTEGLTMGRMVMKPGAANDRHHHPNCEEVLYLLSGRVEHRLDDAVILQHAGDFLVIPPNTLYHTTNIGTTEADLLIAFSSGARQFVLDEEQSQTGS